jgi:uncharacterized protein YdeI (YjbR/CyaY-like superfamily)
MRFRAVLELHGKTATGFEVLAFTRRKEHVRAIEDAKTAETRARRISRAIEKISTASR